jgi:hypothetical protein
VGFAVESSTPTQQSTEDFPPLICQQIRATDADAPNLKDPPTPSTEPKQPMTTRQQLAARVETHKDAKPMLQERCCACTTQSKCKSVKCQCVAAKRKCTSCICKGCTNQLPDRAAKSTQQPRMTAASAKAPPAASAPVPATANGRAQALATIKNPMQNVKCVVV